MKFLFILPLLLLLLLLLVGCSATPAQKYLHTSIGADSVSTYVALNRGASELNPIYPNSAEGAAISSYVLKMGIVKAAQRFGSTKACRAIYSGTVGSSYGAAVNNIIQTVSPKTPIATSLVVGVVASVPVYRFSFDHAKSYCSK